MAEVTSGFGESGKHSCVCMWARMCAREKGRDTQYLLGGFDSNVMKYSCILNQDLLLFQAEVLRSGVRLVQRGITFLLLHKWYNYEFSVLHLPKCPLKNQSGKFQFFVVHINSSDEKSLPRQLKEGRVLSEWPSAIFMLSHMKEGAWTEPWLIRSSDLFKVFVEENNKIKGIAGDEETTVQRFLSRIEIFDLMMNAKYQKA